VILPRDITKISKHGGRTSSSEVTKDGVEGSIKEGAFGRESSPPSRILEQSQRTLLARHNDIRHALGKSQGPGAFGTYDSKMLWACIVAHRILIHSLKRLLNCQANIYQPVGHFHDCIRTSIQTVLKHDMLR